MPIQKNLTDVSRSLPLSSLERVLFHIDPDNQLGLTLIAQRQMQGWLTSVSTLVKKYLDREILIKERTEYFDTYYNKVDYKFSASPVWSIDSAYYDPTSEFDGGEISLHNSNYFINSNQNGIVVDGISICDAKRSLKVIYLAGMAYHPVNSVFVGSNSLSAGNYVTGSVSGAMGKIISRDDTGFTIEVLAGIFDESDTITEYEDLESQMTTGETATISSVTSRALCELYPEIAEAVELQIRYMQQHRDDFENNSTNREGETIRRADSVLPRLQPEARMMLDPYRRLTFFA